MDIHRIFPLILRHSSPERLLYDVDYWCGEMNDEDKTKFLTKLRDLVGDNLFGVSDVDLRAAIEHIRESW